MGVEVLFGTLTLVFLLRSGHLGGGKSVDGVVRIKEANCFFNHVTILIMVLG